VITETRLDLNMHLPIVTSHDTRAQNLLLNTRIKERMLQSLRSSQPVHEGSAQRGPEKGHCMRAPLPHFLKGCMHSVHGIPQSYILRNGYKHSVCMRQKGLQDKPIGAGLVSNAIGSSICQCSSTRRTHHAICSSVSPTETAKRLCMPGEHSPVLLVACVCQPSALHLAGSSHTKRDQTQ